MIRLQNEVSHLEEKLGEVSHFQKTFTLKPAYSPGRHWVAIVDETKDQKTKEASQSQKMLKYQKSVVSMNAECTIFLIFSTLTAFRTHIRYPQGKEFQQLL